MTSPFVPNCITTILSMGSISPKLHVLGRPGHPEEKRKIFQTCLDSKFGDVTPWFWCSACGLAFTNGNRDGPCPCCCVRNPEPDVTREIELAFVGEEKAVRKAVEGVKADLFKVPHPFTKYGLLLRGIQKPPGMNCNDRITYRVM